MNTIAKLICITVFLVLSNNNYAVEIVYDGQDCFNTVDDNDITATGLLIQSKFEVIEDVGQGIYRLLLTGGIPRFINNSGAVCIDHVTALGYFGSGSPDLTLPPQALETVDATGYFNGHELIILVNSIVTDFSAGRGAFSTFNTSRVQTVSNTLIFDYNPQQSLFALKKLVKNKSLTQTSGTANSTFPFRETVSPSSNDTLLDKPKILVPVSPINYQLR